MKKTDTTKKFILVLFLYEKQFLWLHHNNNQKNTKNQKTQPKLKTESQMNLWGYLKKLVVSYREEKSGNELRNNQVE